MVQHDIVPVVVSGLKNEDFGEIHSEVFGFVDVIEVFIFIGREKANPTLVVTVIAVTQLVVGRDIISGQKLGEQN